MSDMRTRSIFHNPRKCSALAASLGMHAVIIVIALFFVAVKVYIKPEQVFDAIEIHRPKLKLRKLQVPVKQENKTQAPKLRHNIVSKPKLTDVAISLPEIIGVPGGTYGTGDGLGGLGFGFEIPDLFGGNKGSGNELVGHFYDLKQSKNGQLSEIGELVEKAHGQMGDPVFNEARKLYRQAVADFLYSWKDRDLDDYFKAQREKFASCFMIPEINAAEAPRAFGVEDLVKPMMWIAVYRGRIAAPENGKYRFVGFGDDILVVRLKKDTVLDASWDGIANWSSSDPNNRKFQTYDNMQLVIGDWFNLQKGRPVPIDVLIGEEPGGGCFFQLYIQKAGATYPTRTITYKDETLQQPILPIFKTADISDEVLGRMKINPDWATVKGPGFGVLDNAE